MCLYPRLIKNKKYESNKKNGGNVPIAIDDRVRAVPVGCGYCMECKKQKKREWQVRLHEEIRNDNKAQFVTMSFSEEWLVKLQRNERVRRLHGYKMENITATIATRKFLERWRKKNGKSVKHWFITELGHNNTERIHIHGLIWTEKPKEEIEKIWKYGNVWVGEYVNEKTINYIVKYVNKIDEKHPRYNGKILTSPGIGKGYLKRIDSKNNKYKGEKTIETYKTRNGTKLAMPIYYRNKIYTEEEKEQLWLNKLDKKERWINGIKIDISKGMEIYNIRLKQEQERSKRLGYGDNQKDWDKIKYENELRMIKKKEREQKVWKKNMKIEEEDIRHEPTANEW